MSKEAKSARKDLDQFLVMAKGQLRRLLESAAVGEKNDDYWNMRLLEELIKEQVSHEDTGHTTRAAR